MATPISFSERLHIIRTSEFDVAHTAFDALYASSSSLDLRSKRQLMGAGLELYMNALQDNEHNLDDDILALFKNLRELAKEIIDPPDADPSRMKKWEGSEFVTYFLSATEDTDPVHKRVENVAALSFVNENENKDDMDLDAEPLSLDDIAMVQDLRATMVSGRAVVQALIDSPFLDQLATEEPSTIVSRTLTRGVSVGRLSFSAATTGSSSVIRKPAQVLQSDLEAYQEEITVDGAPTQATLERLVQSASDVQRTLSNLRFRQESAEDTQHLQEFQQQLNSLQSDLSNKAQTQLRASRWSTYGDGIDGDLNDTRSGMRSDESVVNDDRRMDAEEQKRDPVAGSLEVKDKERLKVALTKQSLVENDHYILEGPKTDLKERPGVLAVATRIAFQGDEGIAKDFFVYQIKDLDGISGSIVFSPAPYENDVTPDIECMMGTIGTMELAIDMTKEIEAIVGTRAEAIALCAHIVRMNGEPPIEKMWINSREIPVRKVELDSISYKDDAGKTITMTRPKDNRAIESLLKDASKELLKLQVQEQAQQEKELQQQPNTRLKGSTFKP